MSEWPRYSSLLLHCATILAPWHSRVCNNRSILLGRWRDDDFALSNYGVECKLAVEPRGRPGRELPEISERLRPMGWGGDAQQGRYSPSYLTRDSMAVGVADERDSAGRVARLGSAQ